VFVKEKNGRIYCNPNNGCPRLYPKLDPFDPKNTDMRHFKFHWEFIYGKIFSNEYFPVISRIGPQVGISLYGFLELKT
jgi:hypothetical protein